MQSHLSQLLNQTSWSQTLWGASLWDWGCSLLGKVAHCPGLVAISRNACPQTTQSSAEQSNKLPKLWDHSSALFLVHLSGWNCFRVSVNYYRIFPCQKWRLSYIFFVCYLYSDSSCHYQVKSF